MKNLTILFIAVLAAINPFSNSAVFSQTNPTAQPLPYYQDFFLLSSGSAVYPAGLQGSLINNLPTSNFSVDPALSDAALTANGTATNSTKGIYNYNGKIGILNGIDGDYCLTLAVKTTGNTNILVKYDIMTIRNPYNGTTNYRENGVELQYRVGITSSFKSVNSRVYINNTTTQTSLVTTGQNVQTYSVKLPLECENQAVVQLRWISRQVAGSGSMPSFALDNIDIEGNGGKTTSYFYKGTGSLMSTLSWGLNSDGSGLNPHGFTCDNQFFVIKNVSQMSFDGLWTVSGNNSKIILGDGINSITFTTVRSGQINAVMDMEKFSTLVISQTTSNLMTFGNLYPGSGIQVLFTASLPYLQAEATYENLLLNSSGGHTYQFTIASPNVLIKKNFTLISTLLENTGTDKFRFQVGGDITFGTSAVLSGNFSNLAELVVNGAANQTLTANGMALNLNGLTVDNNNNSKLTLSTTGGSSNINISSGSSPILNMTGGNVELGTNTVTLGASTSLPGALTYTSGYFTGTGTFARWFSNTGLPTTLTTLFPMGYDTNSRLVQMSFSTAAITSGGKLSVSHSNVTGLTMMPQTFMDNTLRIDRRSNMSWTISQSSGWNLGASTVSARIFASGLPSINTVNDLSLVMNSSLAGGTYSAGTGTTTFPQANRSAMNITQLGGTTQGNTFYIGSTVNSPLPVMLSSFYSSVKDRSVKLSWITESEVNNSGFNVEKREENSKDGSFSAWEKIAFVDGNGTSNIRHTYNFDDAQQNTGKYQYRLKQIDYNGNSEYFSLQNSVIVGKPAAFELSQNYPNPSNPQSKINYQVPFDGKVSIKVYDLTGKEVAILMDANQDAGFYSVVFNGVNLASGVYLYRIIAIGGNQTFTKTMKMILVK
jgi:hypothetical protein